MKLEELGTFIHNKREEAGIPLAKAAQKAGIGRSTLWILEQGRNPKTGKPSRPSKDKLERLALVLHMSQDELEEALSLAGYQITKHPQQSSNHITPTLQKSTTYQPPSPPAATITEINGTVYLASNGCLQAFDARTGNHLWSSSIYGDTDDDVEREGETFTINGIGTIEDEYFVRDELHKALAALKEYVSLNANPTRNSRILSMVLFEDRSIEETAKKVGCSVPVVSNVVRSAQCYVRESLGHQRQSLSHKSRRVETHKELVST